MSNERGEREPKRVRWAMRSLSEKRAQACDFERGDWKFPYRAGKVGAHMGFELFRTMPKWVLGRSGLIKFRLASALMRINWFVHFRLAWLRLEFAWSILIPMLEFVFIMIVTWTLTVQIDFQQGLNDMINYHCKWNWRRFSSLKIPRRCMKGCQQKGCLIASIALPKGPKLVQT